MAVADGVREPYLRLVVAALGVEHVDIVDGAGVVLAVGEYGVLLGRVEQLAAALAGLFLQAQGGEGVVYLVEGREYRLFISESGLVVSRYGGTVAALVAAEVEDGTCYGA